MPSGLLNWPLPDPDVPHLSRRLMKLGSKLYGKSVPSGGEASLMMVIMPRLALVKVQVTVSPALRSMALTGLPSEQVAPVKSQPTGTVSLTLFSPAGAEKDWLSPLPSP